IIEQNAAIFRKFVGEDAVLEHHSAFDTKRYLETGSEYEEWLRRFELASENWDAPLVVTTSVQFFESLFASRTSRCRKLHNICRSVIILDEAQMLPVPFLLPCLEAIKELASSYGCTLVLCTATQPALHQNEEFRQGLDHVREIMPKPKSLYESFRRVSMEYVGSLDSCELSERLREKEQVLCVVNTRREAMELFERINDIEGAYHLSALMCPEHRSTKLAEIKARLASNQSCRLVSTRLIEAGVDIDFPVVFRALAGIDSIAQTAGRCNREGRLAHPGRVFVYIPERGLPPGSFRSPAETASEIMRMHEDPLSLDAVTEYFRLLYWRAGERLDAQGILSDIGEAVGDLFFPFKTVAEKFRLIRDEGQTVLIPWDQQARDLLKSLRYAEFPGRLLRQLQRYTVQVPSQALTHLENAGAIEWLQKIYPALTEEGYARCYRDDVGLAYDEERDFTPESLVF
ncbi:MAG: hypothetical protein RBS57_18680, partial [Desulforhabdus sp.]|nr:hypothetical protein [Desulforhabdus sp.]